MFERLPPKEGINNRISRFALQALDKILYPSSDTILSGGGQSPWSPTTRRELNEIARENDMRRYAVGGGSLPTMNASDHHAATQAFIGVATGKLHVVTSKKHQG